MLLIVLTLWGQVTSVKWEGVVCGMRIAESCQGVICGKFNADFFCGTKGKVRNETMRNVVEMNILLNARHKLETCKSNIVINICCWHPKRSISQHRKLKYVAISKPNHVRGE